MIAKHLFIHGKVQGVWYRDWTVQTATDLGLTGWVRNRSDGTVEILVMGPEDQVNRLIEACHDGPPHADVIDIDIKEGAPEPLDRFEKRPSL